MGRYAVRTRFCEVFVNNTQTPIGNSHYKGVYVFMENIKRGPNRVDVERLSAAESGEPGITGGYMWKVDRLDPGDVGFVAGGQGLVWVYPKERNITQQQSTWLKTYINDFATALNGPDFTDPTLGYAPYIDVPSWIDDHILNVFTKNPDEFVLSFYMFKKRGGKWELGPIWDFDRAMGPDDDARAANPVGWNNNFFHGWFNRLFRDPDFDNKYKKRWLELREGPMNLANMHSIIDAMAAELEEAQERNFERWPVLQGVTWQTEINQLKDWIAKRVAWIDSQFILAPELSHPGGPVPRGLEVTISSPKGELYYTLNGPDPMSADRQAVPEALSSMDPVVITMTENTRIRARGRISENVWTEMTEAVYVTDPIPLVVTEIMYNPLIDEDSGFSRSNFEFIELKNIGSEPLNLDGVQLEGRANFDFSIGDIMTLEPGQHVLVVKNREAMQLRYGDVPNITGEHSGLLSNFQQEIQVLGPRSEPALVFTYEDWYPSTDGDGYSLVIRDETAPLESWGEAESWRPSFLVGGSPGGPDTAQFQLPGDINQDGRLNVGDVIGLLHYLFKDEIVKDEPRLPCSTDDGNLQLVDINGDQTVNLSDAIYSLDYLFNRGDPPALGVRCTLIPGCSLACK